MQTHTTGTYSAECIAAHIKNLNKMDMLEVMDAYLCVYQSPEHNKPGQVPPECAFHVIAE